MAFEGGTESALRLISNIERHRGTLAAALLPSVVRQGHSPASKGGDRYLTDDSPEPLSKRGHWR